MICIVEASSYLVPTNEYSSKGLKHLYFKVSKTVDIICPYTNDNSFELSFHILLYKEARKSKLLTYGISWHRETRAYIWLPMHQSILYKDTEPPSNIDVHYPYLTSHRQPDSTAALNLLSVPPDQEVSTSLKHNLSQPLYKQILQIFCVLLQSSNFSSPPTQVATSQEH